MNRWRDYLTDAIALACIAAFALAPLFIEVLRGPIQ